MQVIVIIFQIQHQLLATSLVGNLMISIETFNHIYSKNIIRYSEYQTYQTSSIFLLVCCYVFHHLSFKTIKTTFLIPSKNLYLIAFFEPCEKSEMQLFMKSFLRKLHLSHDFEYALESDSSQKFLKFKIELPFQKIFF